MPTYIPEYVSSLFVCGMSLKKTPRFHSYRSLSVLATIKRPHIRLIQWNRYFINESSIAETDEHSGASFIGLLI